MACNFLLFFSYVQRDRKSDLPAVQIHSFEPQQKSNEFTAWLRMHEEQTVWFDLFRTCLLSWRIEFVIAFDPIGKQKWWNVMKSSLSALRRTPHYLILVLLPILQKQAHLSSEKFNRFTIQLKCLVWLWMIFLKICLFVP